MSQRTADSRIDSFKHLTLLRKLDLKLRRMDIYIDKRRMYLEMQHRHRKFIARNICTECSFERALSRCVTDISAVEKEALSVAVLAYKLGRTDKAVYLYSVAQCADGNEIIRAFSAHYRIYRAAQIAVSGCTVAQLSVADKRYGYLGMGKRSLFHYSGHRHSLRRVLFKELAPCGNICEQLLRDDRRAARTAGLGNGHVSSAVR